MSVFLGSRVCVTVGPDTHELPAQLGPDALGLALGREHGVAQGAQVVVHGQAFPHVEGAGAEVAERGVLHRRAELGGPGGLRAVILQPPGLPCGGEGDASPSEHGPDVSHPSSQLWGCSGGIPEPPWPAHSCGVHLLGTDSEGRSLPQIPTYPLPQARPPQVPTVPTILRAGIIQIQLESRNAFCWKEA